MNGKTISLREEIFNKIKNNVITGVLAQETIFTDREIAEQMGVSTTPVREALAQLHQLGMIDQIPRKGYYIKPVTIKVVQEIIEFRLIIERSAAELAVERITNEELTSLEKYRKIEIKEQAPLSIEKGVCLNKEFHMAIARSSRNNHLVRAMDQILDEAARLQYMDFSNRNGIDAWPIDHGRIIDALKTRNKKQAAIAVEEGLIWTRDRMLSFGLYGI